MRRTRLRRAGECAVVDDDDDDFVLINVVVMILVVVAVVIAVTVISTITDNMSQTVQRCHRLSFPFPSSKKM